MASGPSRSRPSFVQGLVLGGIFAGVVVIVVVLLLLLLGGDDDGPRLPAEQATPTPSAGGGSGGDSQATPPSTPTAPPPAVAYVNYILDASGSMLELLRGEPKFDVAKDALSQNLDGRVASDNRVGLRVFGSTAGLSGPESCKDILQLVPVSSEGARSWPYSRTSPLRGTRPSMTPSPPPSASSCSSRGVRT